MNYLIIADEPTGLKKKRIVVLIDHNNSKRKSLVSLGMNDDADTFINANWSSLWSAGEIVSDDIWIDHEEHKFEDLYRSAIRAAVQTAKQQNATLADVSAAMTAIINASPRAPYLSALETLASNATAAERDEFFIICAFLFLSKTLGE